MRPRPLALFLVSLALLCASFARPTALEGVVVHVKIEGELDVGTQSLIARALRRAQAENALLVLEINTPGGAIDVMWDLAAQIDQASHDGVRTVAWVRSQALSAGAYLALACERVYLRPGAYMGAAAPVQPGPAGIQGIQDDTVREKINSAVRGSFRSLAEKRGRPPALAEAMVDSKVGVREVRDAVGTRYITGTEWDDARDRGDPPELVRTIAERGTLLSLTAQEAVAAGLADGLAETLAEVLEKMAAGGARTIEIVRARSEDLAALLDAAKLMLLSIAIAALYWEFKVPGFGLPGIVSVVCFALFLFGQYLVGIADVIEIVLIAGGLVLVVAEIFFLPGTLWFGAAGAVAILIGLGSLASGPSFDLSYALNRERLIDNSLEFMLVLAGAFVLMLLISRFLPKTPIVRGLVLAPAAGSESGRAVQAPELGGEPRARVGDLGRALTDLRPVGKIGLDAAPTGEFEARAAGVALERGARVRVVEVQVGRCVVEAVQEPA